MQVGFGGHFFWWFFFRFKVIGYVRPVFVKPVFVQRVFVQRVFIQSFSSNPIRLGLDEMDWTKTGWTKMNWTKSRSTHRSKGSLVVVGFVTGLSELGLEVNVNFHTNESTLIYQLWVMSDFQNNSCWKSLFKQRIHATHTHYQPDGHW